ncbi:hypothetical protein L21SP3_02039 [Sedimentisphaera cyanobacteriorum]|uniref:Uncharacterized protein n=1 Tax=Sedimentisphaera cyanobacteriorum TaxID=1940790 RepID=A0A1Q2HSA6_9BACT|nr:hypothetical protein [Sedimentisphaera cyanobacteriorum]AQQ10211.1 hypothetical protein L21SP3_02039 [Sedimentisphaera cyanobacteriorum]
MKKALILFAAALTAAAFAAPEPSRAPKPGIWTLDVEFNMPRQITLKTGEQTQRYWYIVLTLTNKTGEDVDFYPDFELMTNTWKLYPSDTGITKPVYEKIKLINQGRYPFLQTLDETKDKILQGDDNKIDLLAVWKDFDKKAKNIKLFFAGLSNETEVVNIQQENGEDRKFILQKTLCLEYLLPGDPRKRAAQKLEFVDKSWVMR